MKQNKPPVGFNRDFQTVTGGLFQYLVAGFLLHQDHPSLSNMVPEQWGPRASVQEGLPLSACPHKHILMWLRFIC